MYRVQDIPNIYKKEWGNKMKKVIIIGAGGSFAQYVINALKRFISTIIENPELHKNENLGISKPGY